jgi:predicted DNA-binding transcriptional regulator
MDIEEFRALLRAVGAKKSEVAVFLVILRAHRPISFSEIRDSLSFSEKTIRTALKSLIRRGFVMVTGRGRATRYSVPNPSAVLERLRKKVEERVETILTRLQFHS